MNRQQWKDLLEIIGFVAIILSLVFVGIELRNSTREAALNTQALEIAAYQGLMTSIDEINLLSLQTRHWLQRCPKSGMNRPGIWKRFNGTRHSISFFGMAI